MSKTNYTESRIEDAKKVVNKLAPEMNDHEQSALSMVLKQIALAAVSDYRKALLDASYDIDTEITKIRL